MSNDKMREEFEAWVKLRARQSPRGWYPLLLSLYPEENGGYRTSWVDAAWEGWQASREALPKWQLMGSCPKHVDVLFFNERNGVIPGRLTDADSFMTDKERDEWDGGEEAQFRIDAFGFGHWGVDRMEGCEAPTLWMPYPEHGDEKE